MLEIMELEEYLVLIAATLSPKAQVLGDSHRVTSQKIYEKLNDLAGRFKKYLRIIYQHMPAPF
jgi:hypothetical protein